MTNSAYSVSLCRTPPERGPMDDLLSEYYELMISRLEGMGFVAPIDADEGGALEEFWREIDLFMPPRGRLYLAHDPSGALIGCGSLKTIGATKGELKRLYVRPTARGTGLGRHLVESRIQDARDMGLKELLVDTVGANVEMRGLYSKLGFSEIEFYPESASFRMLPELRPYLCFYRLEL